MTRIRISYLIVIAVSFVLNGWAVLQHLALLPADDGFIAAVLLADMLLMPLLLWAAFIFGEVAMRPHPRRFGASR
jgi:hypothetical protein